MPAGEGHTTNGPSALLGGTRARKLRPWTLGHNNMHPQRASTGLGVAYLGHAERSGKEEHGAEQP